MWLEKAAGDLEAARPVSRATAFPGWIVGFHLQQATEKAMKGLLVLAATEAPRTHDLAAMFNHAGVPCKVTDNLARAHWEKLVWNIPFNGLGVAASAGLDAFARPPGALSPAPSGPKEQTLTRPGGHPLPSDGRGAGGEGRFISRGKARFWKRITGRRVSHR